MAEERPTEARASISDEEVAALLEKREGKDAPGAVKLYDFASQRINRTQLPVLEVVNKAFATRAGHSLSALLGRDAGVHFDSMESVKSADMQASLPAPASLAVIRLKPLNGFGYVSVEPQLLLTLLDGFFGGSGRASADIQAAVAPAAQRFQALMLRNFAPDITAAWTTVTPLEMELVKQETNPRLVQFGGPTESVIVCKFTVEFAARSGTMNWLLPEGMLAPVREALSGESSGAPAPKQQPWRPALGATLCEAQLDTRAVLAEAKISLRELVQLSPGDIIPIDPPQQVTLLAGDVPLYQGRFGVSQGRNALKIVSGAAS
jgi:flagellar motor switch protein FliM